MSEQREDPPGDTAAPALGPDPGTEPTVPLHHEDEMVPPGEAAGRPEGVHDRRPLSVGHLVTGLVFLGISALWLAQEVGAVEVEDMDFLVPLLLVVVGAAGLLAGLVRAARRD